MSQGPGFESCSSLIFFLFFSAFFGWIYFLKDYTNIEQSWILLMTEALCFSQFSVSHFCSCSRSWKENGRKILYTKTQFQAKVKPNRLKFITFRFHLKIFAPAKCQAHKTSLPICSNGNFTSCLSLLQYFCFYRILDCNESLLIFMNFEQWEQLVFVTSSWIPSIFSCFFAWLLHFSGILFYLLCKNRQFRLLKVINVLNYVNK